MGIWLFFSSLMMFAAGQADRLILGQLVPLGMVGIYGLAAAAAMIPAALLSQIAANVIFPVLCRASGDRRKMHGEYQSMRRHVVALGGFLLTGLCAGGPLIVSVMYAPGYADAGWILRWLTAGLWFGSVLHLGRDAAVLATGKAQFHAFASGSKLVGVAIALPLGFNALGFEGAVIAYAVADLVKYSSCSWLAARYGIRGFGFEMRMTLRFLAAAGLGAWLMDLADDAGWHFLLRCVLLGCWSLATWGPDLAHLHRSWQQARRS
jgi:O-antigen/teichoic acid export membrane protein